MGHWDNGTLDVHNGTLGPWNHEYGDNGQLDNAALRRWGNGTLGQETMLQWTRVQWDNGAMGQWGREATDNGTMNVGTLETRTMGPWDATGGIYTNPNIHIPILN
jgi:hypothetical protein